MDIAEIQKNVKETIKITRDEFNGHDLCSIRVFTIGDDGKQYPTKKGITFKVEILDQIIEALKKAQGVKL